MDIVHKIRIPRLYNWQRELIARSQTQNILCVASRRIGKTQTAQVAAIHDLIHGKNVLWIAPTFQQTIENYRAIYEAVKDIATYKSTGKEIITYSDSAERGHIWFRSGDNPDSLRGLGVDKVIVDEFAFTDANCMKVIRPMLTERKGKLFLITSPNGHNHCYDLFEKAKKSPDWFCCQYPWSISPHIDAAEIAKVKAEMIASEFAQEYEASFVQKTGSIFEPDWLRDIFVRPEELPPPEHMDRSVVSVDISTGQLDSDFQAIIYLGVSADMFYVDCQAGRWPVPELCQRVKELVSHHKAEGTAWEVNGFQNLAAEAFCKLYTVRPWIATFTNHIDKDVRIARLATLLSRRKVRIVDNPGGRLLHAQLSDWPVAGRAGATGGGDDCPDALELAWRCLCTEFH